MDPVDGGALPAALLWGQSLLTGSLAQALAIIAFAALGFAALSGRLPIRSAMRVTLGAFILFGAPSIAAGLISIGTRSMPPASPIYVPPPPALATEAARDAQRQQSADPYAGASLPM
jgi:hypothetical protein